MTPTGFSRRRLLKKGAVAGGAALLGGAAPAPAQAPTVVTRRRFKAWISRGTSAGRTTLHDVVLRPISGRQVVVRTEATNLCYSNVGAVLGLQPNAGPPPGAGQAAPNAPPRPAAAAPPPAAAGVPRLNDMALIQGHGGVGIVEAVGPDVRRVQVGDRVCVSGTPQCGHCYQCLRGRADMCQFLGRQGPKDLVAMAEMRDGTPVYANSHIGGLAELMVTFEEWVVPIFTKASAADLGMVCGCVSVAGLGATTTPGFVMVEPASTVAVVGCGPLGLSAVQGARIAGASTIIAIDPIQVRRDMARKVGATHVLDPHAEGNALVERVRALAAWPTDRLWSGGRNPAGRRPGAGADFVIEAAGADNAPSKLERSPDATGVLAVQQAYQMCALGGHLTTTSLVRGNISIPGTQFTIGGVTHHPGQAGGASPMRDVPKFVRLLEQGQYDAKSLATRVAPLDRMLEAYEEVAYRTTITAIMTA